MSDAQPAATASADLLVKPGHHSTVSNVSDEQLAVMALIFLSMRLQHLPMRSDMSDAQPVARAVIDSSVGS